MNTQNENQEVDGFNAELKWIEENKLGQTRFNHLIKRFKNMKTTISPDFIRTMICQAAFYYPTGYRPEEYKCLSAEQALKITEAIQPIMIPNESWKYAHVVYSYVFDFWNITNKLKTGHPGVAACYYNGDEIKSPFINPNLDISSISMKVNYRWISPDFYQKFILNEY